MRSLRNDQRGFILIVVLWVVVLLAIIAAAFTRSTQGFVREAATAARVAEAQAMADGGAELVAHAFAGGDRASNSLSTRRFASDGKPTQCRFADSGTLRIAVQDASGKINVNLADPRLLAGLLAGLGVPGDKAMTLAAHIVDFRDRDDEISEAGAERDDYLAAGAVRGPKNAPLETVLELHQVLGLEAPTVAALTPFVTLYSGTGKLNPAVASPQLIAVVSEGLKQLPLASQGGSFGDQLPAEFVTSDPTGTLLVSILARPDRGGSFRRATVIDVPAAGSLRPKFIAWGLGDGTDPAWNYEGADFAEPPPPC